MLAHCRLLVLPGPSSIFGRGYDAVEKPVPQGLPALKTYAEARQRAARRCIIVHERVLDEDGRHYCDQR
jgi:hypothetical protein